MTHILIETSVKHLIAFTITKTLCGVISPNSLKTKGNQSYLSYIDILTNSNPTRN